MTLFLKFYCKSQHIEYLIHAIKLFYIPTYALAVFFTPIKVFSPDSGKTAKRAPQNLTPNLTFFALF